MDAFETVVASILQRQGFWTLANVKLKLSPEQKKKIGRPTAPRWDLDIVAYNGRDNELRVVECKSYLDSPGVHCGAFKDSKHRSAKRYKLFCDQKLREVVLEELERHFVSQGFCAANPKIKLCLAAGKIRGKQNESAWLHDHFKKQDWILLGPDEIQAEIREFSKIGYENSVTAIVAKLALREGKAKKSAKPDIDAAG